MTLTDGQLNALRNLASKQDGREVAFINIAAARALTDLGLAARNGSGWTITPGGTAMLAMIDSQARAAQAEEDAPDDTPPRAS